MRGDSICAFCSRMKRGVLYSCCRAKGFNKLVLGQHLDDMAESFFMSAFRNGQVCPTIARLVTLHGRAIVAPRAITCECCVCILSSPIPLGRTQHRHRSAR
jgi:hypothetical protein